MTMFVEPIRIETPDPDYAPLDFDPEPLPHDLHWSAQALSDAVQTPGSTAHRTVSASSTQDATACRPTSHRRFRILPALRTFFRIGR